jgi:two-component system chemotaxis sensor kinase CheA
VKYIRQRLLTIFRAEHEEHVQRIREILAGIDPDAGSPRPDDLDEIFRRAHSLKGAARAVDCRGVESLAHRLETLLSRVREGRQPLDTVVKAVIAQVLDASDDAVSSAGQPEGAAAVPHEALAALDRLLDAPAVTAAAVAAPDPPAPAPMAAAVTESAPAPTPAPALSDTVRVHAENLDRLGTSAGDLLTESLRLGQIGDHLTRASAEARAFVADRQRMQRAARHAFQMLDESPELAPASRYLKYVDDHVRSLSAHLERAAQLQRRNAAALQVFAGELQRDVAEVRMVPASDVFEGFRKMVRDVARDAGKKAELVVAGGHLEADRVVLQSLRDPVMHILRNAISHGLEPEAERVRLGKPATAAIHLTLETEGHEFRVIVEDDGRGVDVAKVADIAVRKGLLTEAERAERSPASLARLVLLPGFSTAGHVTDLAGRGMGLSVVAEAVERLQGTVDIGPAPQRGTRVVLSVPVVLSTHRLLFVLVDGQTIGVPLRAIERVQRVTLAEIREIDSKPSLILDGHALPLVSMAHLLGTAERRVRADNSSLSVLLMRTGERPVAVAVDECLFERTALIKNLPPPADRNALIAGAVLSDDGSVHLVVNAAGLLTRARSWDQARVVADVAHDDVGPGRSGRILIVDDSITTRTLEKSVLEAHGYDVATAVDGLDALTYLRAEAVGLVVSDLQMPRLDGFGLLEEMKRDARLAAIPVILVSSVENPDVQARGLALGANAYIVKRKFEQQELLDTIRQAL